MDLQVNYLSQVDLQVYLNYIYQFKAFKHGRNNIREELLSKFPSAFQDELKKASTKKEATKVIRNYLKTEQANIPEIVKKGEWIKYL